MRGLIALAMLMTPLLQAAAANPAELERQSVKQAGQLDAPAAVELPGFTVNQAMVDAFLALPSQRNESDREAAAQRVAELYLLAQAAQRQGLIDQPEHQAGLAIAELNYLSTMLLQSVLAEVDVSEPALRALHERNREAAGAYEYRLSWIVLDSRQTANDVLAGIDDLQSFGLAARRHSLDSTTAEYGGELGWAQRTGLAEPLRAVLDRLEPGEIHQAPIALQERWVLLMLRDKRELETPDFDAIRPALISQARREAVTELVNQLRAQAGLGPRAD